MISKSNYYEFGSCDSKRVFSLSFGNFPVTSHHARGPGGRTSCCALGAGPIRILEQHHSARLSSNKHQHAGQTCIRRSEPKRVRALIATRARRRLLCMRAWPQGRPRITCLCTNKQPVPTCACSGSCRFDFAIYMPTCFSHTCTHMAAAARPVSTSHRLREVTRILTRGGLGQFANASGHGGGTCARLQLPIFTAAAACSCDHLQLRSPAAAIAGPQCQGQSMLLKLNGSIHPHKYFY